MTIGAIGINGTSLLALATKQKAFLAIVGMLAVMAFFPTNFYTAFNLLDMLNSTSILLILAFGETFVEAPWMPTYAWLADTLVWVAALITIWTGWEYFAKAREGLKE